jgi:hypothetical protein
MHIATSLALAEIVLQAGYLRPGTDAFSRPAFQPTSPALPANSGTVSSILPAVLQVAAAIITQQQTYADVPPFNVHGSTQLRYQAVHGSTWHCHVLLPAMYLVLPGTGC